MPFYKKVYPQGAKAVVCEGSGKTCWAAPVAQSAWFRSPGKKCSLNNPILDELAKDLNAALKKARAQRDKMGEEVDINFSITDNYIIPMWGKRSQDIHFDELDDRGILEVLDIPS